MPSITKIIISMIIWGSIGIFVKNINLPSVELAFLRAVIASAVLALVYPMFKSQRDSENLKENILFLILSGGAIGANWILLFKAYNYTTISNATLSYYFAPVFVILLSPVVFKEKLTKSRLIAAAGAMIGLFLIVNNQSQSSASSTNHLKGIAFGLMAAGLYGSVVLLNKYIKGISGYMMTLIQISTSAIVLLPFIIYRSTLTITNLKNLLLIAVLGVVHTGLAYLLYFSGIKGLEVQRAAILSYIDPIAAIIFGRIFLAEPLNLYQMIGGFLILGSTFIGER